MPQDGEVVAFSPPAATRLHYDPPLPCPREPLTEQSPVGSVVTVTLVYRAPFRCDDGFGGYVPQRRGCVGGERRA